jgi:glycosyltransferase involved in cell wall biosynthesis
MPTTPLGWVLLSAAWAVALAWGWRAATAIRGLSSMPDLSSMNGAGQWSVAAELPALSVVVPARNEEMAIEATLLSLLAIEGVALEIVAVDDRSTDRTGIIMDRIAEEVASGAIATKQILRVHHVDHLPEGWLGKTHAMAMAARMTTAKWLLFTDGDVLFREDSLARALDFAERDGADHMVLFPTMIIRSRGERMMMGFLQVFSVWTTRPWKVADAKARRDFLGMGAFNMIRRSVYDSLGGFEALRMEVLEDLRLGYEVKRGGFAQRVAFGPDLLHIHWAEGVSGIMNNMTKNAFAVFRFRMLMLLLACGGMALVCLMPFAALLLWRWAGVGVVLASVAAMVSIVALYRFYRRFTGTSALYAFTFPIPACLLLYTVLRSMVLTLLRGGVIWRGTLYPLQELRKQCGPLR